MVAQKYHTPFCEKNCKIEHHDLVTVLCLDSSQKSDELPDLLRECIDSYQNWDHNGEVPDPLEELRCPLIYLASAFGKAGLVRALLQDNFDARAVNFNGETALHAAVQYIFHTGTLKARGLKVASTLGPIKNRMKAFEQILFALTDSDPTIMFVQDNDGNTAFHAAADNIWNDRQNDRLGRSACFFQFCLKSMITHVLKLEETRKVTREEIIRVLNAENNDGDTILHILARDYAYGFKSMKYVLNQFFPGQVPSTVNKENETVAKIALERNRRRAIKVFPEFLEQEQSGSSISISSDSASSESESASPSTSKYSEESTLDQTIAHQEVPLIVISDNDMPQVTHSIVEDENSSSEEIANSTENFTASADREQENTVPLMTNPGTHDLMTVSIDSSLGKPSQSEVPSFLCLSQKPNVVGPSYDSIVNTSVQAEVMYVSDTVGCDGSGVSKETSVPNRCNGEGRSGATFRVAEGNDTGIEATASEQSDPIAPFSITLSSSDSNAVPQTSNQDGAPPSEERISCEESASLEEDQAAVTNCIAEGPNNNDDALLGVGPDTETSFNMETLNEVLGATANQALTESSDAQVPRSGTQTPSPSPVPASEEREEVGIPEDILSHQQSDLFGVPQTLQPQYGKNGDSSLRGKTICGPIPSELFNPPRKQITETGDYGQLYACRLLDSTNLPLQYKAKSAYNNSHEATSLTSLASASTETIHSETSDPSDLNTEGLEERSTILKCITDNSFLEFLITEGLELDSCSKKGVVDVVMSQYSNRLSVVENAIPTLAAQIKQTETTIGQQKEKVKQLQEELEFVKGEIVKNENSLLRFNNEQQGLSKQRKALKRKVARCEGTMKKLLVNAKKSRCD